MTTIVVRVNSAEWVEAVSHNQAVYIGRAVSRQGFSRATYANPFVIGLDGTREEVLAKYERWLRSFAPPHSALTSRFKDKVLGCWCKPHACHGDLLARLADMSEVEYQEWLGE